MTPESIINLVKRTARMGADGDLTDQAASDIRLFLNNRRFEIWRRHDWDWSLVDILLTVGAATYDQTLPATVGENYELNIKGETGILKRYSRRVYAQWQKQRNVTDTGSLIGYIPLGRDASGNIKLRFFDAPQTDTIVEGWAKKRISVLTSADDQTALAYFPEEMHDLLYSFVLADAFKLMGDARAGSELGMAYSGLKNLIGTEEAPADLTPQAPVPDYIRRVKRKRGLGTGVY